MSNETFWAAGRAFGLVALAVMTLAVVLGIVSRSGRRLFGLERFATQRVHRDVALTATALVTVHVGSLLLDDYARLDWIDLVVPFLGEYRPFWQGLGTLAVDILLAVVATGLLRHRIGPRAFKAVHWSVYALWPISVLHGVGNGTDAGQWWFTAFTAACCGLVIGLVIWRITPAFAEFSGRRRVPALSPAAGRHAPATGRTDIAPFTTAFTRVGRNDHDSRIR